MMIRPGALHVRGICMVAAVTVLAATSAAAQQSDPIGRGLSAAMKKAVAAAAATPAAAEAQDPAPAQAPAADPTLKFFSGTELSGFVDTYYSYNFNKPRTAS